MIFREDWIAMSQPKDLSAQNPGQKSGPKPERVIVDSGWGIKPDDQPSNTAEAGDGALRTYRYDAAEPDVIRRILLAQRRGFNTANRVRIEPGRTLILDINGDPFVVQGLSYGDENLIVLLERLGAAFNPQHVRSLGAGETMTREFALTRAWAWGAERSGG
jgi:hypothetical protein